jgi:outer membrane beta-barrel protein
MKNLRLGAIWALLLAAAATEASASDLSGTTDVSPSDVRGRSSKEPVTVLQNRYFLKAYRPEFSLVAGFMLDEAYTNTTTMGARAGMFLNEWFGFEVTQLQTRVSDSEDRKALNNLHYPVVSPQTGNSSNATAANGSQTTQVTMVTPDPEVNAIHSVTDFTLEAAPFYGKLDVLNKWIIYTDLYATAGMTHLETDQGSKAGEIVGLGERFYIGKSWSVRFDFVDRIFTETRAGEDSRRNSKNVNFSTGYFFQ